MKTKTAIVIPNWNGADFISECLSSLMNQVNKPHIIVVDNGSVDNSVELIKTKFPKVELLEYPNNAGFAGGVNRGIRHAMNREFEFIALFNNDAVADRCWLKELVTAAQTHSDAGIITGKLMRMDRKHIDSTGDFYTTLGVPYPRGRNMLDEGQFNKSEYVFGATGGASLYRVGMLRSIGLFDEDFFAYYEDVDISFRAQLAGWKVWYEHKAVAYHHVSATSSKLGGFSRYHSVKNFILLYYKNMPTKLFWKYKPHFALGLIRMLGASARDRHVGRFVNGLIKSISLAPSTLRKRKHILKTRNVSVSYIESLIHKGKPPRIPRI